MNRRRYLGALATGAAAALSGCTTGDGGTGDQETDTTTTTEPMDTTTETTQTTTTQTTTAMDAATVGVRSTDEYGDVLVDSEGMSLYLFTQDDGSTSTCYGDCAQNWPPLTVDGEPSASDGVSASLGTTERDDGSMQVTAAGHPLYYFAGDSEPGDTNGQGVGDIWYLLAPDGSQVGGTSTTTTTTTTTTESDGGGGGTGY